MKKLISSIILLIYCLPNLIGQNKLPEVQVLAAWFDQSIELLHIEYAIQDSDNNEFTVDAILSSGNGERFQFPVGSTSGDIGSGIINDGVKEMKPNDT